VVYGMFIGRLSTTTPPLPPLMGCLVFTFRSKDKSKLVGPIVGGVVGGAILLILICIICCVKRDGRGGGGGGGGGFSLPSFDDD